MSAGIAADSEAEEVLKLYGEGAFRFVYRYNPRYENEWYDGRDAHQFTARIRDVSVRLTSRFALIEHEKPYSLREVPPSAGFGAIYAALLAKHAPEVAANDARGQESVPEPVAGESERTKRVRVPHLYR